MFDVVTLAFIYLEYFDFCVVDSNEGSSGDGFIIPVNDSLDFVKVSLCCIYRI